MSILSRIKPEEIDKTLYQNFLTNDYDTAVKYAFDKNVINKNHALADYSSVEYQVEKIIDESTSIEIHCTVDLNLRLDKLISNELGISRTKAKILLEQNNISPKAKLHDNLILKNISN